MEKKSFVVKVGGRNIELKLSENPTKEAEQIAALTTHRNELLGNRLVVGSVVPTDSQLNLDHAANLKRD